MKHLILGLILWALGVSFANAQQNTKICFPTNGTKSNCVTVDASNPLPVTSGGGGGAVTIADGADVAEGAKADAAYTGSGSASVISILKGLYTGVTGSIPAGTNVIGGVTQSGTWSVTANAGTNLNTSALALDTSVATTNTDIGPPGATTCATDTGSCSLNALSQRIAQRITSLITALGTPLQAGGTVVATQSTASSLNATVVGTGTFAVQPGPSTSGGLSSYFIQPAASDNHANIKNGAGQVYHIIATNNSATINYLRLYDAGTGFNGCNSATNLLTQIAIPASTSGAGFIDNITAGITFTTGISICVTSGYATTDTTNATASALSVTVGYK